MHKELESKYLRRYIIKVMRLLWLWSVRVCTLQPHPSIHALRFYGNPYEYKKNRELTAFTKPLRIEKKYLSKKIKKSEKRKGSCDAFVPNKLIWDHESRNTCSIRSVSCAHFLESWVIMARAGLKLLIWNFTK